MGWLRDLMSQSESGHRSYGALARAALFSTDWPAESRIGERSLSALFSKLDRDQGLEWLAERPSVQRVLSHVLQVPLEDVRSSADPGRLTKTQSARLLRLRDVRFARSLDLVEEPPCPGIPEAVFQPGAYRATFWRAASGSGRSLVGRFLEARGQARFIVARSFEQAIRELPAQGPAFIELTHQQSGPLPPPPRSDLCVAASFRPRSSEWQVVESPPVASYLEALIAWVSARLPNGGRFDAERTLLWLRRELTMSDAIDSLGCVLGLCGLSDELGASALHGKSLTEIATRFVRERVASSIEAESPNAAWLKKHGFELLLGMGRRLLTDSDLPWDEPRSFDDWLALVPGEHQRGADLDWLRLSLTNTDVSIRPADVERAARKIPPGAFRIVRTFERAGLIGGSADALSLGPRFLASSLRQEVLRSLVSGSSLEWGEALLRGHAAPLVANEVRQCVAQQGARFVDQVLELEGSSDPAQCAALELTLRAAGAALLTRVELPSDSLEALWNDALDTHCSFDAELPRARVEYAGDQLEHALLSEGAFYLAALSVSGELGQRAGKRHPVLRPWQLSESSAALRALCDVMQRDLTAERAPAQWQLGVYALVQRLRGELGSLTGGDSPHPLERPALIVEEAVHGVLSWETVCGIHEPPSALAGLFSLVENGDFSRSELARAIWNAWDAAGRPSAGAAFLLPEADARAWFWPHIPGELLSALLADARAVAPYDLFGDEQWQAFASALERGQISQVDSAALAVLSGALLEQVFERTPATPELFAELWRRAPERALGETARELAERVDEPARLELLLTCAPSASLPALVALCDERANLHDLPKHKLLVLRHFLHGLLRERRPGYRAAFERLRQIDADLARARP
ncbi:MAG TPA: hypothetical protein VGI10_09455 [Polyangiaceae bacterium]|jgi:hypothetical protein